MKQEGMIKRIMKRLNKRKLIQWCFACSFFVYVFIGGLHYSSLFFIVATILMIPNEKLRNKLSEFKIKPALAVCLSVVLCFIGFGVLPADRLQESDDAFSESKNEFITEDREPEQVLSDEVESAVVNDTVIEPTVVKETTTVSSTRKPTTTQPEITTQPETTTQPQTTTQPPITTASPIQNSQSVYITPTGKRYHYLSSCAGENGYTVSLNNAIASGYTPCKKCAQ